MSILAPKPGEKLQAIYAVLRAVRSSSKRCMEASIQGLLDGFVVSGLAQESTPWQCSRCQAHEPAAFRRNGVYRRKLATLCGVIDLTVPRLRCRCGAHVRLAFPVLEPRKRHWWDVWLEVVEGLGERVSVWHLRDRLLRRGVYLSRSTIVRCAISSFHSTG